jgi:hypothetical protein
MIETSPLSGISLDRVRAAAVLRHPNLLPIAAVDLVNGEVQARFQHDDGVTLDRLGDLPLDRARAATLGIGILAGLQALQRAGINHGSLAASTVSLSPRGLVRLTGYGLRPSDARTDVAAAGRILCELLGLDLQRRPPRRSLSALAAAALDIATGGAGGSATAALMAFGDAAGRIGGGFRIERTQAGIARLALPGTPAMAAAVDRVLTRPKVPQPTPLPSRIVARPPVAAPQSVTAPPPLVASPLAAAPPIVAPPPVPVPAPVATAPPEGAAASNAGRPFGPPRRRGVLAGLAAAAVLVALLLAVAPAVAGRRPAPPVTPATTWAAGRTLAATGGVKAAPLAATPDAVVVSFYALDQEKRFDQALALWDDHLKAAYPPQENLYQRFADTTVLTVNKASVIEQTDTFAIVAADLTEVTDGVQHHWVGRWRLVRS